MKYSVSFLDMKTAFDRGKVRSETSSTHSSKQAISWWLALQLFNFVSFSLDNFILRFSDGLKLKAALYFPYIQNSFHDKLSFKTHGIDI